MPICLKFPKGNYVDKWFTYFECFGDGLHLVFDVDNFFHHGCPFFQQIILVLQLNCPFSIYVLVMDKSKHQPYLHGFGLSWNWFWRSSVVWDRYWYLLCFTWMLWYWHHTPDSISGLPRTTYSAIIYVLEFLIMHYFPLSNPKGMETRAPAKSPMQLSLMERFHPPWP